jgi:hypothetical protein
MWTAQVVVATIIVAVLYLFAGVLSVILFFHSKRLLVVVPVLYAIVGATRGFVCSAVIGACGLAALG